MTALYNYSGESDNLTICMDKPNIANKKNLGQKFLFLFVKNAKLHLPECSLLSGTRERLNIVMW